MDIDRSSGLGDGVSLDHGPASDLLPVSTGSASRRRPDVPRSTAPNAKPAQTGLRPFRKTIFHEPWWLDAVAPGRWAQVTVERGGRIVGSLPYCVDKDGPFTSLTMPHLCHVLGPTVMVEGSKQESRQRSALATVGELLDMLPPSARSVFKLDAGVPDALPYLARNWRVGIQYTFLFDPGRSEKEFWGELRDKTRNLIRRSQERMQVIELTGEAFAQAYRANLGTSSCYVDLATAARAHAVAKSRDRSKILAAVDETGRIHGAVLLVWDDEACYYLLATRDRTSHDLGAISLLFWTGLRHASERGLTFDCDGIAGGNLLQFFLGFGGRVAIRQTVDRSTPACRLYDIGRNQLRRLKRKPGLGSRFDGYPG